MQIFYLKSNLENVLQKNLRTNRAREYIFRASEGTNFENFPAPCQPWGGLFGFSLFMVLLKKTLDMSLVAYRISLFLNFDLPEKFTATFATFSIDISPGINNKIFYFLLHDV